MENDKDIRSSIKQFLKEHAITQAKFVKEFNSIQRNKSEEGLESFLLTRSTINRIVNCERELTWTLRKLILEVLIFLTKDTLRYTSEDELIKDLQSENINNVSNDFAIRNLVGSYNGYFVQDYENDSPNILTEEYIKSKIIRFALKIRSDKKLEAFAGFKLYGDVVHKNNILFFILKDSIHHELWISNIGQKLIIGEEVADFKVVATWVNSQGHPCCAVGALIRRTIELDFNKKVLDQIPIDIPKKVVDFFLINKRFNTITLKD